MICVYLARSIYPILHLAHGEFDFYDTEFECSLKFIDVGLLQFVFNITICGYTFYLLSFS